MTPLSSGNTSIGRNWTVVMAPSAMAEPVSCSTSHACATVWAHVPMPDTSWLDQNQRYSGTRKAGGIVGRIRTSVATTRFGCRNEGPGVPW